MADDSEHRKLAREAKAIVALAFRNGPIEDVHAGRTCPTCMGHPGYSRISDAEMKAIMKNAVNRVYALLASRTATRTLRQGNLLRRAQYVNWDERNKRQPCSMPSRVSSES